jgi:fused signal recognition particle receptor
MALGFIKKVFSFGRAKEEEQPAADTAQQRPEPLAETTEAIARLESERAAPAPESAAAQRPLEAAPTPVAEAEPVAATQLSMRERPDPSEALTDEGPDHFPHDGGDMAFTPETLPGDDPRAAGPTATFTATPQSETMEAAGEAEIVQGDTAEPGSAAEDPSPVSADAPEPEPVEDSPPAEDDRHAGIETPAADAPAEDEAADAAAPVDDPEPAPDIAENGPPATAAAVGGEPTAAAESGIRISRGDALPANELAAAPAAAPRLSWFQRLRQGLSRTSSQLTEQITGIFTKRKLDDDTLQDLEDVLIRADLGVETAMRITDTLASGRYGKNVDSTEVATIMADEIEKVLGPVARPLELDLSVRPHVILVVGVNGTGKTTTIGKLAAKLVAGGLKVTLAAGDTFRAAAIEQLKIWGERTGSEVVSSKLGADAAGLAYDAFEKARDNGSDVLIVDTAGRLQNKAELMAELEKVVRVIGKLDPDAPHTVLQTLDATTGQNALTQVEIFRNVAGVNGLVMTKLDGSARGGILVAIAAKHRLPVYFIGVGEGVDDLEPFEAKEFAAAIAGRPLH